MNPSLRLLAADLSVSGLGKIDVYSPTTKNTNSIVNAIEKKNRQAEGVLVQTDLTTADMASVANRIWGKSTAQNIKTLFFQDQSGNVTKFTRP